MNGTQLQLWRNYHMLTQAQLARMLGVHEVTVARWECGMRRIPSHLGLSLETIQRELPAGHKRVIRRVAKGTPDA